MKLRLAQMLVAGMGVTACLMLTACASGTSDDPSSTGSAAEATSRDSETDTPTDPGEEESSGSAAECVVGEWALDTENAGMQLWAFLQSAQISQAGDVDVSGDSRLSITADGRFGLQPNLNIAATIDMHGLQAVLWQHHTGQFQARWKMDDPTTMRFESVGVNEYAVDQAFTMDGIDIPAPIDIPPPVATDMPPHISCEGDTLIYSPPEAPITSVWRRIW